MGLEKTGVRCCQRVALAAHDEPGGIYKDDASRAETYYSMKATFLERAMSHFGYLLADYGFSIRHVDVSARSPETEGRVELETGAAFVTISSELWSVSVSLGRVEDDKYRFFLDPTTIHEYVTLTQAERELVCSFDPKDDAEARRIVQRIRLLHQTADTRNSREDIDRQLANYSIWLTRYADPFLRGDFSGWLEIYEYKVMRNRAAHIRSGKEELVRTVGQNGDRKQSIFQASLEYLERLRTPYGREQGTGT